MRKSPASFFKPFALGWIFSAQVITSLVGYCPSVGQPRIQNFGIAQGLPQSQVPVIVEDSLGYLWLGTLGGGLTRFDGQTFETFTSKDGLINNFVQDLLIDSQSHVWIATNKGISMFDGIKFQNLKATDQEGLYVDNIFINGNEINCLLANNDLVKIWYDSTLHYKKESTLLGARSVTKSVSGATYLLHGDEGSLMLTRFGRNASSTVAVSGAFTRIYAAFRKGDGDVLSTNGGLFSFSNGKLELLLSYKFPLYCYNEDDHNFIGINDTRILLVDTLGHVEKQVESIHYLVLTTLKDRDDTFWVGTDQGLFKIDKPEFQNPLQGEDRLDAAQAICHYDDKLWIGTNYSGVKVYSDNKLVRRYDFKRTGKNYVIAIKTDKANRLWLASMGGVAILQDGNFVWQFPDVITSVMALEFDKNNDALIGGARRGLYQIKNGKLSTIKGFESARVWCIKYNEPGDLFAIGTTAGVKIFKDGAVTSINAPLLQTLEVAALDWLDGETLVMGTLEGGIFIYSFASHSMERIDVERGLGSDAIFLLYCEGDNIWAGSEKGIDKISYNRAKKEVVMVDHFTDANGLLGRETNLNAVYRMNGRLLFGLVKGLYEYKPLRNNAGNGRLHLKSLSLFYKPLDNSKLSQRAAANNGYSFNHDQNHLTFAFNEVNKRNPENHFYTYRLVNFDQIWSKPSRAKVVTYGNLPPGAYTFQLRATDQVGVFTFDQIEVKFTIHPAFYQTGLFKILSVVLAAMTMAAVAYWIYRAKARRILALQLLRDQEQARLRRDIARDFHDELGNQVARMLNYVGLLRISEKMEKDTYSSLHGHAHAIITGTKDFVWALDPTNDDLESVLVHLRDFGEQMFSEKGIKFSFYGEFQKIRLPMGYGRQINLIFKEAMTNAFRHSGAKSIDFGVTARPGKQFVLQLHDDGTGMSDDKILASKRGMENMRSRARKIESEIQITSNGAGVRVSLLICIPWKND